jgi:hypothetical protein
MLLLLLFVALILPDNHTLLRTFLKSDNVM